MGAKIRPQPGILEISLYQGGKAAVEGVKDSIKLSSNENPFGPSPAAQKAFRDAAHQLHRYPSSDHLALRQAIGKVHGLNPEQIICGAGSDELISFLCQAYAGVGDEVLFTEHGFSMYRISALAAGATPVQAKERERVTDVDALLAACTDKTRLVFIANPNNPTGTMIGGDEVARLADGLPPQALLVLDGAYAEYVQGFDGGAALVQARDNVMMLRTFSKIYGLGGLRIGWGYGPQQVIDVLNRVRGPFNLSQAQMEAAIAAVKDQDYVTECRDKNTANRAWLAQALAEIGVPSDESHANFILARFGSEDEALACDAYLQKQGLITRLVRGYNLPNCLRITIGDQAACRRVAHAIAGFKEGK
ncbi:MAG: histidinol-phosphate transaminase [Rhodobacterales bacterium]|nr:MAG: histidinol-phosphate transaminase [Rhodobacterales bacterium]